MARRFFLFALLPGLLWGRGVVSAQSIDVYPFQHENVMGTSMELHVRAGGREVAEAAERRVLAEIDRLSRILSGYDPESEFRRWQKSVGERRKVSAELFAMLQASETWTNRSGGAFDPRVEAFTQLWTQAVRERREPSAGETREVLRALARPAWRLDPHTRTVERLTDVPLSLNAIAKGAIIERACRAGMAGSPAPRGLLLNIGGDLRVCGDFEQVVGIVSPSSDSESADPLTRIMVRDRAVATSGRSQRSFEIKGRKYSHIFDPRTGRPVEGVALASVVAPRSADADALATILNVVPPEEGLRLVRLIGDCECMIVTRDGRVLASEGWSRLERPLPLAAALARDEPAAKAQPEEGAPWGERYELAVDFEINRPDLAGQRYRRPYVAVWVENKDGFPVRNLILWVSQGGAGPFQWIPDLRRWYRDDQARKKVDRREMVLVMARPTRPPGKYSVVWDGKDDKGKPVGPGEYTLVIDAAREHGTYQSISKVLTIGDQPFSETLPGNIEIKGASVEYRRKGAAK